MDDFLPFPVGSFVKITKLSACPNPVSETSEWDDYVIGEENVRSLPVQYFMRGFLTDIVRVGGFIQLDRTERNGVIAEGEFTSTLIMKINGALALVETFNSIYRIERSLPPGDGAQPVTDLPPVQSVSAMAESAAAQI